MQIIIDGLTQDVPDHATLQVVLELLGESTSHALVEVNGKYIPAKHYRTARLKPGDRLEIIYPAFGG